jgi:23S rRNA (guanosine2251-2'-O)-methyltransferase
MDDKNSEKNDLIIGRNSVLEALKSGRAIDSVIVAKGDRGGSIGKILAECRALSVTVKETDPRKLDYLCGHANHQGIAAYAAAHKYSSVGDMLALARERGEQPFLIICDGLEDPHNLGAVIRTAETSGAHGVIIPKRNSASLSFATAKTAAGALEYVPVARVTNITSVISYLKKSGLWIYGAETGGKLWCDTDMSGAVGLVIGSEGCGISRLVRESCDFIVSLPMKGQISSLNASVAAGVMMYEIARQRIINGR